jgi:hypothetical protein
MTRAIHKLSAAKVAALEFCAQMLEAASATRWQKAEDKLSQFRRHPDWRRAHHRVCQTRGRQFFTVKLDEGEFKGQWAIPDDIAAAFIDAIDQEFIDEIIRTEGKS